MIRGYARVSTDGQSVDAQVCQLTKDGCKKVFRETASGAQTGRSRLRKALQQLDPGDVLTVTRLDRLARSIRDLLNTLAAINDKEAGFRSLGDTWADITTAHGRLMLTILDGLADFERDLIRVRTGEGRPSAEARGVKMGRPPKLTSHQVREAPRRRDAGEAMREIARNYKSTTARPQESAECLIRGIQLRGSRGYDVEPAPCEPHVRGHFTRAGHLSPNPCRV